MRAVDGRSRRWSLARWRDQRGQTFPFVVVVLFCLFIVAGAVINVGQAVNRRIYVQMLADTGAFTGATEMARGMNTLAQLNGRIQKAWSVLTFATSGFTAGVSCAASDLAVEGYWMVHGATRPLMDLVNTGYGLRAGAEARRVTQFNQRELFPGESLQMGEGDGFGFPSMRPSGKVANLREVMDGTEPAYRSLSNARHFARWGCVPPPLPPVRVGRFSLWYEKPRDPQVAFVWVVKAPATRARVFDSFFGPNLIPEMTAVAAARPVGGEIKMAKDRYVAKMVPVRRLKGSVFDMRYLTSRTVRH
jgi:hypothetical protein